MMRARLPHSHMACGRPGVWGLGLALLVGLGLNSGQAQQAPMIGGIAPSAGTPAYHLKLADYQPPSGAAPGSFRRMIQPFGGWTLICDENLKQRTKICNASQTVVDSDGRLVFSWSLAATSSGVPVFVVRANRTVDFTGEIILTFSKPSRVKRSAFTTKCDVLLCVGFLPMDDEIRQAIVAGSVAHVVLAGRQSATNIELDTTLKDLSSAIAAIK